MVNVDAEQNMQGQDEIKEYQDLRQFGSPEASWRLFSNSEFYVRCWAHLGSFGISNSNLVVSVPQNVEFEKSVKSFGLVVFFSSSHVI